MHSPLLFSSSPFQELGGLGGLGCGVLGGASDSARGRCETPSLFGAANGAVTKVRVSDEKRPSSRPEILALQPVAFSLPSDGFSYSFGTVVVHVSLAGSRRRISHQFVAAQQQSTTATALCMAPSSGVHCETVCALITIQPRHSDVLIWAGGGKPRQHQHNCFQRRRQTDSATLQDQPAACVQKWPSTGCS